MKKKILAIIATGLALGLSQAKAQDLTIETNFAFESEYVFRGVQLGTESFQPSIDIGYDAFYLGLWTNQPTEGRDAVELDYYAGYKFKANDQLTIHFGATVYHYPELQGDNETLESFIGLGFDTIASPSVYVFYDYDLEAFTYEASIGHSFEVDEKNAIEVGLSAGYVSLDDSQVANSPSEYYYYGASAQLVHAFSDTAKLAIGIHSGGNDEHIGPAGRDDNLWGSFSFSAGF